MSIFEYNIKKQDGQEISLKEYEGKVLLIVNTATECGFTPQYEDLEKLYKTYHDQGLEILDFPCNQFGHQAPGSDEDIHAFCTGRFGVTFPQFTKIEVNGVNEFPLYTFLKKEKGFKGFKTGHPLTEKLSSILLSLNPKYKDSSDIKWNFTKFLVSKTGEVIERYEPMEDFKDIEAKIKELL